MFFQRAGSGRRLLLKGDPPFQLESNNLGESNSLGGCTEQLTTMARIFLGMALPAPPALSTETKSGMQAKLLWFPSNSQRRHLFLRAPDFLLSLWLCLPPSIFFLKIRFSCKKLFFPLNIPNDQIGTINKDHLTLKCFAHRKI